MCLSGQRSFTFPVRAVMMLFGFLGIKGFHKSQFL
jgi:hypothetical protein